MHVCTALFSISDVRVPDASKMRKESHYRCLCCVWLRALFSSGRLRAGIKVRRALYADLSRNRPRRHATLKTYSAHNLLVYRNKPAIKRHKSREHTLLTSDIFSLRSVASQVYYFSKAPHQKDRSKRLYLVMWSFSSEILRCFKNTHFVCGSLFPF